LGVLVRHTSGLFLRRWVQISVAAVLVVPAVSTNSTSDQYPSGQNWTNYVRIAAYSLNRENPEKIVASAKADHVFGIEVDNDIPGRYDSFLDPTEKLKAIREVAERAHRLGNYAFVYIAGTECITANADKTPHTMAKDHPDWLQRKITGEPALFGGGTAFWIQKGDEDVWISPFAAEWRKIYMLRVRQIAETGIDGIYVDIPYWMTHFEGWENSWASFDDHTIAAFKKETGLDVRHDLKLGDFSDENFRKWVDFRIRALTDFVADIDRNAKSVNPKIKTIPEIYPGIEQEAVRVGSDVYEMYGVVDAIAHEYEFGNGDHMASGRAPLDWFKYQVGMHSFRAFAQGKATWILNYSWDGDKHVAPPEPMKNLAMSEIMAGANFWDARGHVMSGSNDPPTRKQILQWIEQHERTFYSARQPLDPIGIYFSPATRNYFTDEFLRSYQGILILLMQAHQSFQIVTPRTLAEFRGRTLVLPDVRILDEAERRSIAQFAAGQKVVITGKDVTGLPDNANVVRLSACPGKKYMSALETDFAAASPSSQQEFLGSFEQSSEIQITASPWVATSIASVNGMPHIFLANFRDLRPGVNAVQTPERAIITVPRRATAYFLPFLGSEKELPGQWDGRRTTFALPAIQKGAVVWVAGAAQ
jgi:hypothetical protein